MRASAYAYQFRSTHLCARCTAPPHQADEITQIILGPDIDPDEEVPIAEALEIVRRSLDSIRQLNTAVMNGNPVNGRLDTASTMVRQDSNDFGRMFAPIAASSPRGSIRLARPA